MFYKIAEQVCRIMPKNDGINQLHDLKWNQTTLQKVDDVAKAMQKIV